MSLLELSQAGEIALLAPDLILTEFANLAAKKVRRRQISARQAKEGFEFLENSTLMLSETRPLLARALELALRHHMSLWDCVYIALAIERDCALITADRRLFNAGTGRHPVIRLLQTLDH